MRADSGHDLAMLVLNAIEIGPPLFCGSDRHPDGLTRNDEAAEVIEEARELRIAGCLRDPAVKGEVLIDSGITASDRGSDGLIGVLDATQIGGRRPLGRKTRRLDLDPGALSSMTSIT